MRIQNLSWWMTGVCLGLLLFSTPAMAASQGEDIFYFPQSSPSHYHPYKTDELLIHLGSQPLTSEIRQFIADLGGQILRVSARSGWIRVRFSPEALKRTRQKTPLAQLEALRRQLLADARIRRVELNPVAKAMEVPNDPYWRLQWNFHAPDEGGINLERAWEISTGEGVTVALLDTGLAYEDYQSYHAAPDLAQTRIVPGYDFVNDDEHPNDDHGHGTHVAGTIAQSTNNGLGVAGVAPDATLMPIKVLDSDANGDYFTISEGIYYAVEHGAQVINLSLGGTWDASVLEEAVRYASKRGVILVAAAGNEYHNGNPVIYPAAYDECIAVGASTYERKRAHYSSTGDFLDLVAPGGDTTQDRNRDGYGDGVLQQTISRSSYRALYYYSEGTSMAAPHVSGIVALLIAAGVREPAAIREALMNTAHDLGPKGWDSETGAGLVDAYAALTYRASRQNPDVALAHVQLAGEVTAGQRVPVLLALEASSLDSPRVLVEVRLEDGTEREPITRRVWLAESETSELQVDWVAPDPGEYTVSVWLKPIPGEANTENNRASVTVQVVAEKAMRRGTSLYASIQQRSIVGKGYWEVLLDVWVRDEFRQPVPGAQVVIDWKYDAKVKRTTALSDATGHATIRSGRLPRWTSPTYYKRAVIKEGYRFAGFLTSSAKSTRDPPASEGVTVRAPDPIMLGPNYPNPFNPETWIPFRLGIQAPVAIEIYDIRGTLVRRLDLGVLGPGRYEAQGRAAYWDGRDARGDPVASGLYYYTLRAGPYQVTRKMVVRR